MEPFDDVIGALPVWPEWTTLLFVPQPIEDIYFDYFVQAAVAVAARDIVPPSVSPTEMSPVPLPHPTPPSRPSLERYTRRRSKRAKVVNQPATAPSPPPLVMDFAADDGIAVQFMTRSRHVFLRKFEPSVNTLVDIVPLRRDLRNTVLAALVNRHRYMYATISQHPTSIELLEAPLEQAHVVNIEWSQYSGGKLYRLCVDCISPDKFGRGEERLYALRLHFRQHTKIVPFVVQWWKTLRRSYNKNKLKPATL